MNNTLSIPKHIIIFGIPLALFAALILLTRSPLLQSSDTLALAITADLLLSVPLIYFLLIRKTKIPNITAVPVMILGLIIGSWFLPESRQTYLELFKTWALPVVEVSIVTFIILKVRNAVKRFKSLSGQSPDFFSTLKEVCYQMLPQKLVLPFVTEIAVMYYGFISWRSRPLHNNEFSYHKKSGTPALLIALIFVIAIETFVFHILLAKWSIIAAWIASGLSTYTAIQVFGFARSLSKRPVSIDKNSITLRYGILCETNISFEDIESVTLSKKPVKQDKTTRKLSPLGELESHNIIIHLNKTNTLTGLYGIKKTYKTLAFYIDDASRFKVQIENALTACHEGKK